MTMGDTPDYSADFLNLPPENCPYMPGRDESRVLLAAIRVGLDLIRANTGDPQGLNRIYQISIRLSGLPRLLAGQMFVTEAQEHLAWLEQVEAPLMARARQTAQLA